MEKSNFSKEEMIGQMSDVVEDYISEQTESEKAIISGNDYDKLADKFAALVDNWTPEIIKAKKINLEDAADVVCMNCVEDTLNDNSCCEKCPVRKTMDYIKNTKENVG